MSRDTWPARYEAGATLHQIAKEDGAATSTVYVHLLRSGVKMRQPGPIMTGNPREWPKLYWQGYSLAQIAAKEGCTPGCVHRHLRLLGVKMRGTGGSRARA